MDIHTQILSEIKCTRELYTKNQDELSEKTKEITTEMDTLQVQIDTLKEQLNVLRTKLGDISGPYLNEQGKLNRKLISLDQDRKIINKLIDIRNSIQEFYNTKRLTCENLAGIFAGNRYDKDQYKISGINIKD